MISIIGAGSSGNYLAYLLAKEGKDVRVFEEHSHVGKPVQCTGLVTGFIKELVEIKEEFVVNEITKIKVIAPDGNFVEFNLKNPNFVFDRERFDLYLAEMARKQGVEYYFDKKFLAMGKNKIKFSDGSVYDTDYLVGADGITSSVAKYFEMFNGRKFMNAIQARCRGSFDANEFVVYLEEGYFGWSVPENRMFSRIGVIASNSKNHFDSVLEKQNAEVVEHISGLIPVYQPDIKCQKDNVFLIGDAATQCKASTHGGIIQGMIAAQALRDSFLDKGSYDKLWRKKLGRDLWFHLKIREKLDKLDDKDINYIVRLVQKEKIKKVLETHERDFASKLIFKMLIREPRFLKLALQRFKSVPLPSLFPISA